MTYEEEVYDLKNPNHLICKGLKHPVIKRAIKRVIKYVIKQSIKELRGLAQLAPSQ